MRILVDVTHPAHVHFFRSAIKLWQQHGHEVAVTARRKDVTVELLENFNIPFTTLSEAGKGLFGLFGEMLRRDVKLLRFCKAFKPDVLTAIGGVYAAHVGFLLRKPVVVWDDTEVATIGHKLTHPFAKWIMSPDCYTKDLGKKQKRYAGLHELAYLHPNRFTPDAAVVKSLGIDPSEKYCLLRFVSWQAHHDVGQYGFDNRQKEKIIQELSKYAKVYITAEGSIPEQLKKYQLKIPVHLIHHVLAFAKLYIGEGATMATEGGLLGVPAVYVNSLQSGNMNMLANYGLLNQTTDAQEILKLSVQWLTDPQVSSKCSAARQKLLDSTIDVTEFVVATIEKAVVE